MSLEKQFSKLNNLQPSEAWLNQTKNFVLAEFDSRSTARGAWLNRLGNFNLHLVRTLVAIVAVTGVMWGGNIAAKATYLPSQPLYFVKQTLEKFELLFAFSPESEAQVRIQHALNRADEALKIANNQDLSKEEKQTNLEKVVRSLESDINNVSATLNTNKDSLGSNFALDMTTKAKEASKTLTEALNSAKAGNQDQKLDKLVNDAVRASDNTQDKALQVLVGNALTVENAVKDPTVSAEKIQQLLRDKISELGVQQKSLFSNIISLSLDNATSTLTIFETEKFRNFQKHADDLLFDAGKLVETRGYIEASQKLILLSNEINDLQKIIERIKNPVLLETKTDSQSTEVKNEVNQVKVEVKNAVVNKDSVKVNKNEKPKSSAATLKKK